METLPALAVRRERSPVGQAPPAARRYGVRHFAARHFGAQHPGGAMTVTVRAPRLSLEGGQASQARAPRGVGPQPEPDGKRSDARFPEGEARFFPTRQARIPARSPAHQGATAAHPTANAAHPTSNAAHPGAAAAIRSIAGAVSPHVPTGSSALRMPRPALPRTSRRPRGCGDFVSFRPGLSAQ